MLTGRINNVINISASIDGKFFNNWLEFLRPFHKLTNREIDVLASFLKYRFELSKVVKDTELLDKIVMGEDTKRKVRKDCNLTQTYFQVIMTKLKKNRIVENGRINPKLIPRFTEGDDEVQLLLLFDLK